MYSKREFRQGSDTSLQATASYSSVHIPEDAFSGNSVSRKFESLREFEQWAAVCNDRELSRRPSSTFLRQTSTLSPPASLYQWQQNSSQVEAFRSTSSSFRSPRWSPDSDLRSGRTSWDRSQHFKPCLSDSNVDNGRTSHGRSTALKSRSPHSNFEDGRTSRNVSSPRLSTLGNLEEDRTSKDDSSGSTCSSKYSSLLDSAVFEQSGEPATDSAAAGLFLDETGNRRIKRYKLRVLRDLLKNFNIEERIEHYRSLSVVTYPLNPKNFSLHSAMEASQKRERLVRFTGSDEVRVNDRRYMDALLEKMRREDEGRMRKAEERRAEAERQRLRRLLAQGLITTDDMEDDSALYYEMERQREAGRKAGKNNKQNTPAKKPRTRSSYASPNRKPAPTPRSLKPSYSPPPRSNTNIEESSTRRRDTSSPEVESQMSKMNGDGEEKEEVTSEGENEGDDTRQQQNGEAENEIQEEGQENNNDEQNENAENDDDADTGRNSAKGSNFERYEDPRVRDMREEESVEGLYRIAEELIIPTYKPKRKAVKDAY